MFQVSASNYVATAPVPAKYAAFQRTATHSVTLIISSILFARAAEIPHAEASNLSAEEADDMLDRNIIVHGFIKAVRQRGHLELTAVQNIEI